MPRPRPILIVNINLNPRTLAGCRVLASTLEAIEPGIEALVVPWRMVDQPAVDRLRPRAVLIGPNDTPFPAYPSEFDTFLAWLRRRRAPTLAICGGHQALALAHGSPIGPLAPVPAARGSYAGMPKVSGPTRIRLMGDPDPLLAGLPVEFEVAASHVDEVKEVPPDFRLLAIGDPCHIQAIRADRRPVYGLQFHPEKPASAPHGRRILANWLALTHTGPRR